MPDIIEFDRHYYYDLFKIGIVVPATLSNFDLSMTVDAAIDTGSTYSVFERYIAERLEIELETGLSVNIGTATGSFRAYGHELSLSLLDIDTTSTVYFAESEHFDRNVLGRTGFLDRVKLGLIEPEGRLFLSRYQT